MIPFARQMTAALAAAMFAAGSPAAAAVHPSAEMRMGMAAVPMPIPIAEPLFAVRGAAAGPSLTRLSVYGAHDGIEIERQNLLLAPPGNEALRLYLAASAGFLLVALLMVAMLVRKPGRDRSSGA